MTNAHAVANAPHFTAGRKLSAALSLLLWATAPGAATALADTVIFSDNFTESTLNPAWQVLPGQGTYSLAGDLRYVNQGPLSSPYGWATTSLSLALPFTGTDWEADVKASYSLAWCAPGFTYTGPPVPNFSTSSGAQRSDVMVSFDPVTGSDRSALSGNNVAAFDRGVDAWYGANVLSASYGSDLASGLLNPAASTIDNNIAGGTYWYQIVRNGGTLTMSYSYDGVHYSTALSTSLADPSSSYNELLLTGWTYLNAGSYSDFDSVTIKSLSPSPMPEPSAWIPLAVGLACIAVKLRLRNRARKAQPRVV